MTASNDREVDRWIGENVRRLRMVSGNTSQEALAEGMRGLGHAWSQATVWSVEKGKRPLRLSEARSLADVLRVPVQELVAMPEEVDRMNEVALYTAYLEGAMAQLYKAAAVLPLTLGDLTDRWRDYDPPNERAREINRQADQLIDRGLELAELAMPIVEFAAQHEDEHWASPRNRDDE